MANCDKTHLTEIASVDVFRMTDDRSVVFRTWDRLKGLEQAQGSPDR
jgi:hypothetical protein